jgi:hypothetical protein
MISEDDEAKRLHFQRNVAAVVAVILIVGSIGAALPGVLRRARELKAANAELVDLQASIVAIQQQTRDTQAEIIRTQEQILARQRGN